MSKHENTLSAWHLQEYRPLEIIRYGRDCYGVSVDAGETYPLTLTLYQLGSLIPLVDAVIKAQATEHTT